MRSLLCALSALQLLNGLLMLLTPPFWYGAVPGVDETGPFNAHFVRDAGLGFLSAGFALWLAAIYPLSARLLVTLASVFLVGHALLHLAEIAMHGPELGHIARDLALIVVPALLPLMIFARRRCHV
ncbi:hypothetical protein NE852_26250 (plasmid) [Rhizobium sp. Pop5]|uniref:hypothetical protein n=1 Tax=Rhizobium sp. Pop5 TaxID=1223565 RepID=UPI000283AA04|nr:hypothetical protein [Rhizobium sp. Pop5]EJZ19913.1 hypothetical protein RCCGEPOP_17893 [Rhizobium sp. Pop5]UVD59933.1 hypothetical protein NE852_26250 [Rhizobium sp. Pop5]